MHPPCLLNRYLQSVSTKNISDVIESSDAISDRLDLQTRKGYESKIIPKYAPGL